MGIYWCFFQDKSIILIFQEDIEDLQELLNNSLRHGKATEISIQFTIFDNRKICTYIDNGLGFDSSSEENQKGLGMKNIESRINFLGGDFNFTSKPNEGVKMVFNFN